MALAGGMVVCTNLQFGGEAAQSARHEGRRMNTRFAVSCLVFSLSSLSCVQQESGDQQESAPSEPTQLVARSENNLVGSGQLAVGRDCRSMGSAGCAPPSRCVHSGTAPRDFYVCVEKCKVESDCPEDWACMREDGTGSAWCVPPVERPTWQFDPPRKRAAQPIAAPMTLVTPTVVALDGGSP
jgi:hypothetical protein